MIRDSTVKPWNDVRLPQAPVKPWNDVILPQALVKPWNDEFGGKQGGGNWFFELLHEK